MSKSVSETIPSSIARGAVLVPSHQVEERGHAYYTPKPHTYRKRHVKYNIYSISNGYAVHGKSYIVQNFKKNIKGYPLNGSWTSLECFDYLISVLHLCITHTKS